VRRPTYDQKQAAAVLMTCVECKVQVYATQPTTPYRCVLCREKEPAK
jgi:hypothetical protein